MWGLDAVRSRSVPLAIYTHLFDDDHAETMAALGALGTGPTPSYDGNVIPLHG
jgi:hypothetical protein